MADAVHDDVLEEILMRFNAEDLNRYKRVCKSWPSLITICLFVKRHLNLSYNKDRYNNELGLRIVSLFKISVFFNPHTLVGSSNGLVCICTFSYKLIAGNPLTKEIRQLSYPLHIGLPLCWGFGYDSSTDDYKVFIGTQEDGNNTCFQLLNLKSNVWRDIGERRYRFFDNYKVGILCNGALHWIIKNLDEKKIISYDLSKEEFKEIPQPSDASYKYIYGSHLGILKECLCIVENFSDVWLMKKYNHVKESWELVRILHKIKYDILHFLRLRPKDDDASWFCRVSEHLCWEYIDASIYVKSLVSPHNARGVLTSVLFYILIFLDHISYLSSRVLSLMTTPHAVV